MSAPPTKFKGSVYTVFDSVLVDRVYLVHIVESTEAYGLAEQNDSPMDVIEMGNVLSAVYQAMPDVERMDVDVNKCTDMLLTWMVKLYDP